MKFNDKLRNIIIEIVIYNCIKIRLIKRKLIKMIYNNLENKYTNIILYYQGNFKEKLTGLGQDY